MSSFLQCNWPRAVAFLNHFPAVRHAAIITSALDTFIAVGAAQDAIAKAEAEQIAAQARLIAYRNSCWYKCLPPPCRRLTRRQKIIQAVVIALLFGTVGGLYYYYRSVVHE